MFSVRIFFPLREKELGVPVFFFHQTVPFEVNVLRTRPRLSSPGNAGHAGVQTFASVPDRNRNRRGKERFASVVGGDLLFSILLLLRHVPSTLCPLSSHHTTLPSSIHLHQQQGRSVADERDLDVAGLELHPEALDAGGLGAAMSLTSPAASKWHQQRQWHRPPRRRPPCSPQSAPRPRDRTRGTQGRDCTQRRARRRPRQGRLRESPPCR